MKATINVTSVSIKNTTSSETFIVNAAKEFSTIHQSIIWTKLKTDDLFNDLIVNKDTDFLVVKGLITTELDDEIEIVITADSFSGISYKLFIE